MTDDLVARLRNPYWSCTTNMMIIHPIQGEAANEIERLLAKVKRLDHAATTISECYNEAEAGVSNLRAEMVRKGAAIQAALDDEEGSYDFLKWKLRRDLAPAQEKSND